MRLFLHVSVNHQCYVTERFYIYIMQLHKELPIMQKKVDPKMEAGAWCGL